MEIRAFSDRESLVSALVDGVSSAIESAVAAERRASLVVPGGSTPQACFDVLSKRTLPWSQVDVTLSDERWVAATDPSSNQRMLAESLFVDQAAAATLVPLIGEESTPEAGAMRAMERLSAMTRPFDVVLLGMGTDGHTASLFPDMPNVGDALADGAPVCLPANPPSQPMPRLTLSAEVLSDTRALWVLITGQEKRDVLEAGLSASLPPPVVSVLSRHSAPVVWWAP